MKHEKTDGGMAAAGFDEKNDCVVRALSIAAGVRYETMHRELKDAGRRSRCRTKEAVWGTWADEWCGGRLSLPKGRVTTVRGFVEAHPIGRFVVRISGHALAIIDGVVHDNLEPKPGWHVKDAWEF